MNEPDVEIIFHDDGTFTCVEKLHIETTKKIKEEKKILKKHIPQVDEIENTVEDRQVD